MPAGATSMTPRLILCSVCLLSAFSAPLLSADESIETIQLQLNQRPDADCDGVPEQGERVAPGTCVIYEIEAVNISGKDRHNVLISTRIPEHTILMQTYNRLAGDEPEPVDSIIEQGRNGIRLLKTRLDKLQPGTENKVTLHYSVKIL